MRLTAALALAGTLFAACGPSWPSRATTISDPRIVAGSVHTIDVLPVDLQLWTAEDVDGMPETFQGTAEASILEATLATDGHMYRPLSWNGDYAGQPVLEPRALEMTVGALSGYGSMEEDTPHALPVPYLPARLDPNADATLYIGGWSYVSKPSDHSTAAKIAEGVLIVVAVVAVIAIIAAVSKSSGGGHGGGGGGGAASGVGHAAGHVLATAGRVALRAGNLAYEVARTTTQVGADVLEHAPDVADEIIGDAFGHVVIAPERPNWEAGGPHDGDSQMYLEATLVDNRTGLALWHARQTFPARADRPEDVHRAVRVVLATMPR